MLLKNLWIHDGLGRVDKRDILIEDGKIVRIADVIDGDGEDMTGKHLLPGFIDPFTCWGINGSMTEIRPSSEDNDELSDPVMPELDIRYAVNGRAMTVQQLGLYGLTAVGVTPTDSNIFGGRLAAYETDGINPFKMLLKADVGMKASVAKEIKQVYGKRGVAPMTRMGVFQKLGDQLRQAAAYDPAKEGVQRNEKLAALKRVTDGELPLWIAADTALDRLQIMELLEAYPKTKVVFTSCYDLQESDLGFDPARVSFINGYDGMDMDARNRGKDYGILKQLLAGGFTVAVSGKAGMMYGRETQLWEGCHLAGELNDPEETVSLMTAAGAKLLGIVDITGTVEEGKRADLTIWSEHPLTSFRAHVVRCMIAGRTIYAEGDAKKCYV